MGNCGGEVVAAVAVRWCWRRRRRLVRERPWRRGGGGRGIVVVMESLEPVMWWRRWGLWQLSAATAA
uniref:Uncharacterized protein n=1 Tax=Oryza barthii TaxID=65489 RepID=A0A0D3GF59_9ORYZ